MADIGLINELNAIKARLSDSENHNQQQDARITELERVNDQYRQRIEQLERRKK